MSLRVCVVFPALGMRTELDRQVRSDKGGNVPYVLAWTVWNNIQQ